MMIFKFIGMNEIIQGKGANKKKTLRSKPKDPPAFRDCEEGRALIKGTEKEQKSDRKPGQRDAWKSHTENV